nr:hypothetical protein [Tanacetum cinerariifolium]
MFSQLISFHDVSECCKGPQHLRTSPPEAAYVMQKAERISIAETHMNVYSSSKDAECDSITVCELLLGLQPWQKNPDSKCDPYTSICNYVGWCRCRGARLVGFPLLPIAFGVDGSWWLKSAHLLAWQHVVVLAAMTSFRYSFHTRTPEPSYERVLPLIDVHMMLIEAQDRVGIMERVRSSLARCTTPGEATTPMMCYSHDFSEAKVKHLNPSCELFRFLFGVSMEKAMAIADGYIDCTPQIVSKFKVNMPKIKLDQLHSQQLDHGNRIEIVVERTQGEAKINRHHHRRINTTGDEKGTATAISLNTQRRVEQRKEKEALLIRTVQEE